MELDVCLLCPLHNGAGLGARRPRGRKVLLQKTDTAHSAQVPFFRDNAPAHSQSEKKPRGSWVRHGDERLKATGSPPPPITSSVQSQHSAQDAGGHQPAWGFSSDLAPCGAGYSQCPALLARCQSTAKNRYTDTHTHFPQRKVEFPILASLNL